MPLQTLSQTTAERLAAPGRRRGMPRSKLRRSSRLHALRGPATAVRACPGRSAAQARGRGPGAARRQNQLSPDQRGCTQQQQQWPTSSRARGLAGSPGERAGARARPVAAADLHVSEPAAARARRSTALRASAAWWVAQPAAGGCRRTATRVQAGPADQPPKRAAGTASSLPPRSASALPLRPSLLVGTIAIACPRSPFALQRALNAARLPLQVSPGLRSAARAARCFPR